MHIDIAHATARTVALLASLGIVAVSCGTRSATTGSGPDTPAAVDTTTIAVSVPQTTAPAATTTSAPTSTVATEPRQPRPYWAIPDGIEVAVAGIDGLHLLTGNDNRIISATVFEDVVADPSGDGWLVQEWPPSMFDPTAAGSTAKPSTIRHISDDGSDEVIISADPGKYLQLHDAGLVDGRATVFYNVNLQRTGMGDPQILDELFALDITTGERRKITDVGGWEMGVDLSYGGDKLVGVWGSEATVMPWSVDLAGRLGAVDVERAGLAASYTDDPAAPMSLASSADGDRLSWVSWDTGAAGTILSQLLVVTKSDGSNRREFILPAGPARLGNIVDRGGYLVAGSGWYVDGDRTPAALIDGETGGMLILPVGGPAAAQGQWGEPPRWPIPSPVSEDVTEEITALEPLWANGNLPFEYGLAEALLADDGAGECASTARSFPNHSLGDGPFYIELRQFCDDSGAGYLYEVSVVGPQLDGSLTGGAIRRALCWRGVTPEGLCV